MEFFGFGGGGGGRGRRGRRPPEFIQRYICYPVSFVGRSDLETGNKILLPPSALDQLARLSIVYPMLFSLQNSNDASGRVSHCGVLEFTAQEGRAYIPYWLMQSLLLEEGGILTVRNVSLPLGKFVKLKPQSVEFLDITSPKAVLENALRSFATLTQDDVIKIHYNDRDYYLAVEEVKPHTDTSQGGICVIETDMEVDFSPPVGYVEPTYTPAATTTAATASSSASGATAAASSSSGAAAGGFIFGAGADAVNDDASSSSSGYDSSSSSDDDGPGESYWDKLGAGNSLRGSSSTAGTTSSPSQSSGGGQSLSSRDQKPVTALPEGFQAFTGQGRSLRD